MNARVLFLFLLTYIEKIHTEAKQDKLKRIYSSLHKSNPFSEIKDVLKWQRKVRADRELFN